MHTDQWRTTIEASRFVYVEISISVQRGCILNYIPQSIIYLSLYRYISLSMLFTVTIGLVYLCLSLDVMAEMRGLGPTPPQSLLTAARPYG